MSGLPSISGRECVRALSKAGFYALRQEGSHLVLHRDDPLAQLVVPDHKELDRALCVRSSVRLALAWTNSQGSCDIHSPTFDILHSTSPMTDIAIRVENLSKLYPIGRAQQRHDTLRDSIADFGLRIQDSLRSRHLQSSISNLQ